MANRVDLAWVVLCSRHDLQLGRQRVGLDHEGVVSHDLERVGNIPEYSSSIVTDAGRLPVHQFSGAYDFTAVGFANSLVAEADTKDRNAFSPAPDCSYADFRV